MALALTAALTFTPIADVMGERWIPAEYLDDIRKEAHHRNHTSGNVVAPPPMIAGVEQWRDLVAAYWPPEHVDRMLRIMKCESGGNPNAYNPGHGEKGLFQIHPLWQKAWPGNYYDPWTNAAVAYQIWLTQGYAAWVCKG